ncbi:amidohydrolase family protein [Pseudosulfitobacter sp. DSM 107133]|uniref:amidohydrolase family protein n=1 Tax=Pseudosulfitobacter sp. DSM 107133 TaxID=2883100 RepID=UPI000DF22421|nr:amidohydrolase family protein [Pseudosulfitobacter sp. DSM 107133]UOA28894.1 Pterin deaminase [Pseudosulfitobacter sp. DSM 107133]
MTDSMHLKGITLAGHSGFWDLEQDAGRITALRPATTGGGGLVTPLLADIHTHLDKTMTAPRMPHRAQSLFDAIEMMGQDAARWTDDDLRRRASLGLAKAYHHGTALMRSHVDWSYADAPRGWHVLSELAQDWRGRVELQLSSLTRLDELAEIGPAIAPVLRREGGILGAFVYRNENLAAHIASLFDLAEAHDLHLDFHVDEGLDVEARGIDAIIDETAKRGMAGRVLCGHGCALSVRDVSEVKALLARAAEAGVGLTVLPGANSYLQDAGPGRTPRLRGIAPLQEADTAGVPVMLGSDNVRDGFFPYGDYDLIEVLRMGVLMGHLPPEDWLDAISARPAAWMGHDLTLRTGGPADFIHFDATDLNDVISRPAVVRRVWRDGAVLPPFQGDK